MKSSFRLLPTLIVSAFLFAIAAVARADAQHVALQLYSLRYQLASNAPAALDEVKSWGITNVELAGTYKLTPEQFKAELDARGLNAFSGHFPFDRLQNDIEGVARDAQTLGLKYVGCAWIPHDDNKPFDEKTMRQAIAVFNHAGEVLAQHGLKFFYHVHGYEFQPIQGIILGPQGMPIGTLFDLLMSETNPKFVNFEMDVFWIVHPGQDPVKLLEKYPSRWILMHLKGMRYSTPTGLLTGHSAVTNDVAVGTGKINYVPIVATAKKIGIKWLIIEDESPVSEQQIPQSYKYLEALKW
jgi:sugar phosphate isomerase/epimerase